jgi:hypothetical protein
MTKQIKNKYEIHLGPVDALGIKYLQNLIRFIKLGAEIKEGTTPTSTFPHRAWLTYETTDLLKNEPGVQVFVLSETFTREQLEAMDWDEFRAACKKKQVKGRDRTVMLTQYLKTTGQDWQTIPGSDKSVAQSTEESEEVVVKVEGSEETSENKEE